jgi:hypothetical protein
VNEWQIHHDNAPFHSAQLVQQCLAKYSIPQVRQFPCSPDMAPCDLFLLPLLKNTLKDERFNDMETNKYNVTEQLLTIPKTKF